jgi:hypothetical protein
MSCNGNDVRSVYDGLRDSYVHHGLDACYVRPENDGLDNSDVHDVVRQ